MSPTPTPVPVAPSNVVSTGLGLEAQQAELAHRVTRATPADGLHACAIPGVSMIRASMPSQPLPTTYHPCVCVVVQGRKHALLAKDVYVYDPLNYLVVSMTLPMAGQIVSASAEQPYLCLRIDIDPLLVGELSMHSTSPAPAAAPGRGLFVARTGAPLLDAVLRLVRLLDAPEDIGALAPLAVREIHYRILCGELGERLRALCELNGPGQRIARAIELLKARFAEPLRVETLADAAHMSVSTFHARFRAVTSLTPLQFQKQLRLHEARRLLLGEGLEAATVGHRVGYESPSQFSREYRRLFGAPPKREVAAARSA